MVVTSEGVLHVYSLDLEVGGECVLQKTFRYVQPVTRSKANAESCVCAV